MRKLLMTLAFCVAGMTASAQKELVILNTNDTHSTVMPLSVNLDDTMKAGRGGYLRRLAAIERERERTPDLLLFDSGDFSQGSAFYTLFKGDVEVGLMNMMRYDAVAIGNHEFDYGLENMARLFRKATFPIVCANYDFTGTVVEGTVKPYVILKRGKVRVGVFGLSPRLDGLVVKDNYAGVRFTDPVEAARTTADLLKNKKGCDVVICLSHLGWDMSPGDVDDSTMISRTRNIDLVLGGHSHSYFKTLRWVDNADGVRVPVDQNGKHGIYMGRMVMAIQNRR